MPRLTRLRFVNVGHVNARMEDLILECCDKNGHAIDTTLWLRNGGGKSSILNLFYSLINPNRRQFLGSKADQGERGLGDYILEGDAAVVIAEWQLDTNEGDEKKFYLTGCFYEWQEQTLERLFFTARVTPYLTLDSVPIKDSQGKRFKLHGFKQEWQNLGKRSELDTREFDNQTEAKEAGEKAYEEFTQELEPGIEGTEVRAALIRLSDKDKVKLIHEQALERVMSIKSSLGSSNANVDNVRAELNRHEQNHPRLNLNLNSAELELSNEELEKLELQAKADLEQAQAQAKEREEELKILDSKQREIAIEKNNLETLQEKLDTYWTTYKTLFQDLPDKSVDYQIEPTSYSLKAQIDDTGKILGATREHDEKLLKQRNSIYNEYTRALRGATAEFARQLQEWTEEMLELDVQKLLEDLETREKNIQEALEESEEHRKVIITETVIVADLGIQLLQSLANSSKLPEKSNMLAGHKFLKITLNKTIHPSEKEGRVGELIDDIIHDKQILTGMQLIQRAVRKLAQHIKVEVLFPDMDSEPRYLPITDMSKESGGERLTSAVLLYCSLAQQRAKARGKNFLKTSSTLLLDNPVGTASRAKFLALQRETAKAMNIQLIYATGVNDFEAIRTMPNVVRLRNEKRNSKHHRLLEVAHVIRPDSTSELGAN